MDYPKFINDKSQAISILFWADHERLYTFIAAQHETEL